MRPFVLAVRVKRVLFLLFSSRGGRSYQLRMCKKELLQLGAMSLKDGNVSFVAVTTRNMQYRILNTIKQDHIHDQTGHKGRLNARKCARWVRNNAHVAQQI